MMKKIALTALVLGGTTLGMGIGYASADGVPDVQTETVEVVKEVEVPGPTQTKEVEVVKWKTRTEEVEVEVPVTPQACLDAIDAAEEIGGVAARFSKAVGKYPPLVGQAFTAGLNQDQWAAERVLSKMESANVGMEAAASSMGGYVQEFNAAKTECRSS